ncbi:MAG: cupredoxin domain-containing protein [Dehalococcoidia bacterium]
MRSFACLTPLRVIVPLSLLFAAGAVMGCGSNYNSKAATAAPATQQAAATLASVASPASPAGATGAATAVDIKNIAFPATITVKPGTKVTWTNRDGFPHTVTSDAGQAQSFDSKPIAAQATFSVTFATAGTYAYHCNIHPSMHGTIVVSNGAAVVSTPATTPGGSTPRYHY